MLTEVGGNSEEADPAHDQVPIRALLLREEELQQEQLVRGAAWLGLMELVIRGLYWVLEVADRDPGCSCWEGWERRAGPCGATADVLMTDASILYMGKRRLEGLGLGHWQAFVQHWTRNFRAQLMNVPRRLARPYRVLWWRCDPFGGTRGSSKPKASTMSFLRYCMCYSIDSLAFVCYRFSLEPFILLLLVALGACEHGRSADGG